MSRFPKSLLIASLCLCAGDSIAGSLSGGTWTPSGCGTAPKEYKLDLSNPDAFNASVQGVNQYRQSSRDYVECAAQEANNDIQTITRAAKAAQQARLDAEQKIADDVKAADKKFGQ
ncbi:MAG: hypothetical protein QM709_11930 [Spongiibacteraceae bacterium]